MRTQNLALEEEKEIECALLEGERVALIKHHMLSFHRSEAALGTVVLTNYRLAFYPDDTVSAPFRPMTPRWISPKMNSELLRKVQEISVSR